MGCSRRSKRLQGIYFSERDKKHTLNELIERYFLLILPSKPNNAKDITRHLQWWKQQLGSYALNAITPDMITKCRQQLAMGLTPKGAQRKPATVNRYNGIMQILVSHGWVMPLTHEGKESWKIVFKDC